jgi:Ergosterol biosynthesis ERG4/ERG24 family
VFHVQGKKQKGIPFLYDFYRGCELHPHVFGVDAKQLSISRIGMILWQLLVMAAFYVGPKNAPDIVSLLMQTIYIAKFYW